MLRERLEAGNLGRALPGGYGFLALIDASILYMGNLVGLGNKYMNQALRLSYPHCPFNPI
jgi:hypothetical protein